MATLPGLVTNLTLNSAQFEAGVRRVNQQLSTLNRTAGTVRAAFAGFLGALSVQQLTQIGRQALDAAGGLGEMAQQAGVTTKQLQVLTVAGLQAGVSQEQLITSLGQFGRRVGEAAQGTGELRNTLAQYNIAVKTAGGETRASVDVLGDLAEAVQNAASQQEQLRIASDAFGARVGTRLVPLLAQGREGFEAWAQAASDAGLIIDDELVSKADAASDSLATLQHALGTGFQIGVVQSFADSVGSGTEALRQAREAGEALGTALGTAMRVAAEGIKLVVQYFRELGTLIAAFIAYKLAGIVLTVAGAMYEFAKAIRAAAVAHELLNLVTLRGKVFVTLLAAIVAAGVAYQALGGDIESVTGKIQKFFDEVTAGGLTVMTKDAEAATDKVADLRKETELTIAQQKRLREVLGGGGEEGGALVISLVDAETRRTQVEKTNDAIEIQNELIRVGLTFEKAQETGLYNRLKLAQELTAENARILQPMQDIALSIEQEAEMLDLVIKARGRETEELRVQQRLLEVRQQLGATAATALEPTIRALEHRRTLAAKAMRDEERQLQASAEAQADLYVEPLRNALTAIQGMFANTYEQIFSGGITTFGDLANEIKRIFIHLAAEIATLMTIQPILEPVRAAISGGVAAGAAGAAPSLAQSVAGTGLAGNINRFGGRFGFAAPTLTAQQPLVPGGIIPFGATNQGAFPLTLAQTLGFGAAGGLGGAFIGNLFGGRGAIGGGIGGGLGAIGGGALAGTAILPGIGTGVGALIGGLAGALGGGFLGSLFGGAGQSNNIAIRGALGSVRGSGAGAKFVGDFDKQISALLDSRQLAIANQALRQSQAVSVKYSKTPSANDLASLARGRIAPTAAALGFNAARIAQGTPEEQLANLQRALELQDTIRELTRSITPFEKTMEDLSNQFRDAAIEARDLGVSTKGLDEAFKTAARAATRTRQLQIDILLGKATPLDQELRDLSDSFKEASADARRLGLDAKGIDQAFKDASRSLKAAQQTQIDQTLLGVSNSFQALRDPLQGFLTSLKFANLNPLQQLEAARKDFERIANLARAGSTVAIGQLQGAGELFERLAEQVGASPGGVSARAEVATVIESVLADIDRAQREASAGLEAEIRKAADRQIDTLKELIRVGQDTVSEIKKLRRS